MLIYLWESPYSVPYGGSCLAACGSTQEEARRRLLTTSASFAACRFVQLSISARIF